MSRCGLALAAILAASPVSAANVTAWANLVDCHKCAERYGVRARNLSGVSGRVARRGAYASH